MKRLVVFLPRSKPADADEQSMHEDELDRHVEEVCLSSFLSSFVRAEYVL